MKPRVGLLLGDHAGIGPEIVVKLLSRAEILGAANVLVIGEHWAFEDAQRIAGVKVKATPVTDADPIGFPPVPPFSKLDFSSKTISYRRVPAHRPAQRSSNP